VKTASFLCLLGALAVGCGDIVNDVVPPGGSCNAPMASVCIDYTGTGWRTPNSAQMTCTQFGASSMTPVTYASGRCATTSRVGLCRLRPSDPAETYQAFYGPRFTAQTAQAACVGLGGSFQGS